MLDLKLETVSVDNDQSLVDFYEECLSQEQRLMTTELYDHGINMVDTMLKSTESLAESERNIVLNFLLQDSTCATRYQEISTEGQKIQDFLRWGLGGMVIGLYLGSFTRLKGALAVPERADLSRSSQYLLPEKTADKVLGACEQMVAAIKSGKADNIRKALQQCGYKIDVGTDTDWMAVLGSYIGAAVGAAIGGIAVSAFGVCAGMVSDLSLVGNVIGKSMSSRVMYPASAHGYTSANITTHIRRVLQLINSLEQLKQGAIQLDDSTLYPAMKKIVKLTCQAVSTIGRGYAALCIAHV